MKLAESKMAKTGVWGGHMYRIYEARCPQRGPAMCQCSVGGSKLQVSKHLAPFRGMWVACMGGGGM